MQPVYFWVWLLNVQLHTNTAIQEKLEKTKKRSHLTLILDIFSPLILNITYYIINYPFLYIDFFFRFLILLSLYPFNILPRFESCDHHFF